MKKQFVFALVLITAGIEMPTLAQQPSTLTAPRSGDKISTYYYVGLDVHSPELLPSSPLSIFTGKCKKQDGSTVFDVIVDETGDPQRVTYSQGLLTEADKLAFQVAKADHFMPDTHNGEPAAVAISVRVNVPGRIEKIKDEAGNKTEIFHLRAQPSQEISAITPPPRDIYSVSPSSAEDGVYRVGGGVTAPVPLNSVQPHYTNEAKKAKIQGNCWISLVVDANGIPQNAKVIRSLDPGLDQNALDAVSKYRFKPAMKDGHPVPVTLTLQVNFKLY